MNGGSAVRFSVIEDRHSRIMSIGDSTLMLDVPRVLATSQLET